MDRNTKQQLPVAHLCICLSKLVLLHALCVLPDGGGVAVWTCSSSQTTTGLVLVPEIGLGGGGGGGGAL